MKENSDSREIVNDLWKQTENIHRFALYISFLKEISWRRIVYSFYDFCMGDKQKTFIASLFFDFFLEGNPNKKGKKGKKREKCHFRIYSRKQRCSLNFLSIFSLFPFFLQKNTFLKFLVFEWHDVYEIPRQKK